VLLTCDSLKLFAKKLEMSLAGVGFSVEGGEAIAMTGRLAISSLTVDLFMDYIKSCRKRGYPHETVKSD